VLMIASSERSLKTTEFSGECLARKCRQASGKRVIEQTIRLRDKSPMSQKKPDGMIEIKYLHCLQERERPGESARLTPRAASLWGTTVPIIETRTIIDSRAIANPTEEKNDQTRNLFSNQRRTSPKSNYGSFSNFPNTCATVNFFRSYYEKLFPHNCKN